MSRPSNIKKKKKKKTLTLKKKKDLRPHPDVSLLLHLLRNNLQDSSSSASVFVHLYQ
jgi:hypothetical protein